MLGKLLSLIAQAKGAAIATVVVASAATATVGATDPAVQDAVNDVTSAVGSTLSNVVRTSTRCTDNDGGSQPAVVAQRNAADKLLRAAHQDAKKALLDLRGGKNTDNKAVGEIVKKYDDQLKDALDTALTRVASVTLGREGQVRKAEASASGSAKPKGGESAKPSGSGKPEGSKSPRPSCSPKPSGSAAAASPTPSESPRGSGSAKPSGSGKPDDQGRVAVAERTTLDAGIKAIVDQALLGFTALVKQATDEAALVPAPDRGKPSDKPDNTNKPEDKGGRPSENPGGGNKPSNSPGRP